MLFQVMLPSWSDVSLQPVCKTPGRMFLRVVLNVLHWEKQILRYWPRNLKVLSGQVLVHTAQVDKAQLPWRPKDQSEVKAMSGNWKSQMRAGQPMWNSEAEAGQSRLQEADDRTKPSRLVWSHCLTSHPHLPRAGRGVSSLPREAGAEGKVVLQTAGDPFYSQWQHRARTCSVTSWGGSTKQAHMTKVPSVPVLCSGIASWHMMDHRVVSCTAKENTWVTCCLLKYLYSDSECRICYSSFLHIKVI